MTILPASSHDEPASSAIQANKVVDLSSPSAEKRKRTSQNGVNDEALKAVKVASDTAPNKRPSLEAIGSQQKVDTFWKYTNFAVVGASNDSSKVGYEVFQALKHAGRDVVPVNIHEKEIQGGDAVTFLSDLPDPRHTVISVVVPPEETLKILETAKELQVPMIWLQPGAVDSTAVKFIQDNDLENNCIYTPPPAMDSNSVDATDTDGTGTSGPCGRGLSVLDSVSKVVSNAAAVVLKLASPCILTELAKRSTAVSLQQKEAAFWNSTKFAVVGASNDTSKAGYKIFQYLKNQGRDVVPVNTHEKVVQGSKAVAFLSDLPDPRHTVISIMVPPEETLKVLKDAKDLQIPMIWLRPGTANDQVEQFIQDNNLEDICILTTDTDLKSLEFTMKTPGTDTTGPCP